MLGVRPATLDNLDENQLPVAAQYLEAAGRLAEAARAYRMLGDAAKSAELLARHSRYRASGEHTASARTPSDTPDRISAIPSMRPTPSPSIRPSAPSIRPPNPGSIAPRRQSSPPVSTRQSSRPPDRASGIPTPSGVRRAEELAAQAEAAGDFARAAVLYEGINALAACVRCWMAAGQSERALTSLVRFPREDPQYRRACVLGVELCVQLDRVDFDFDHFSGPFFDGTPTNEEELNAFYRAGLLFEKHGHLDNAKEAFQKVQSVRPDIPDVAERLARIEEQARGSKADFERVVKEDDAFRAALKKAPKEERAERKESQETFPSLPELPQLPPRSRRSPPGQPEPRSSEGVAISAHAQSVANGGKPSANERAELLLQNVYNIPAGLVVSGRYKIDTMLGRGGMGAVYRAHDLELDETIAIKLFSRGSEDQTLVSRFKQELTLARQISHPNVIRLYDLGVQGSVRFITMELLAGRDLADRMEEEGRDLDRDLGYLIQVCRGLQCVHERGVVHRDLKPENLFVTNDGVVKLMDFGIAKRQSTQGNLTVQGFSAGTPAYMSPEQIENFAATTHLSDIYSLGVIAYRLFTGELPFENENPMAVLMKHLKEVPRPPSEVDPSVPEELEYIILQLLEKDPAARIQSCAEIASDIDALRTRLASPRRR